MIPPTPSSVFTLLFTAPLFFSCMESSSRTRDTYPKQDTPRSKTDLYYEKHKGDSLPSKSTGTEGAGALEHAKLAPFSGPNYRYFDEGSYLGGRAFMNHRMKNTLLASYAEMETLCPGRIFSYMECSQEHGGHIPGHRTHQHGLSVDLMVPLVQDGKPCYKADSLGAAHYLLDFDHRGRLKSDTTMSIDFNTLALHIGSLRKQALKNGLRVKKVILMLELKDDLFATPAGKELKKHPVYFAMNLPPFINLVHDDHFHVDFEPVK
ncbi:MAG: hypothetical protein FD123_3974 [Bacteroidetes bacterium]|nr:MAG: hypothetical protein FD123_3974 [Bacteroidota bacterium]